MTATYRRIIITAIALIAAAGIACAVVVSGGCSAHAGDPFEGARNGAANALIDISGVKGRVNSQLRDQAADIAERLGIPQGAVEKAIDSLAIEDWQATTLPDDVTETGSYPIKTDEVSATLTTYDDPSVVTVSAWGQSVTMAVPKSARGYLAFAKYLKYLS